MNTMTDGQEMYNILSPNIISNSAMNIFKYNDRSADVGSPQV